MKHFLWSLFCISLPLSKALSSVCLVLLLLLAAKECFFDKKCPSLQITALNAAIFFPALLIVLLLVGVVYSQHWYEGLQTVYKQNALLLLPLVFWVHRANIKRHIPDYICLFSWANVVAGMVTLLFYVLPPEQANDWVNAWQLEPYPLAQDDKDKYGLYSPFIQRIQFSLLLAIATLQCCWLLKAGKPFYRKNALILLPILLLVSLLLGGRGSQIGLFLGLMVWVSNWLWQSLHPVLNQKTNGKFAKLSVTLLTVILVTVIPIVLFFAVPQVSKRYGQMIWEIRHYQENSLQTHKIEDHTSIRRFISWKETWGLIAENPWFGVGTGDYRFLLQKRYDQAGYHFTQNSHNQFLHIWASIGIGGFLFFVIGLGYWLHYITQNRSRNTSILATSFLFLLLPPFLTDATLVTQVGSMGFVWSYLLILDL